MIGRTTQPNSELGPKTRNISNLNLIAWKSSAKIGESSDYSLKRTPPTVV